MFVFVSSKALRGWFVVDVTLLDLAISDLAEVSVQALNMERSGGDSES